MSENDEAMSTIEEEDRNATQRKRNKKAVSKQVTGQGNRELQSYVLPIRKPEGSTARWACDFSLETVQLNFQHMFNAMMQNIVEKGHVPSAKLFLDLAERAEEMQSGWRPKTKMKVRKKKREPFSLLDLLKDSLGQPE